MVGEKFGTLDVGIGKRESIVLRKASADGCAGGKRGRDDEGILKLAKLVRRDRTAFDGRSLLKPGSKRGGITAADDIHQGFLINVLNFIIH